MTKTDDDLLLWLLDERNKGHIPDKVTTPEGVRDFRDMSEGEVLVAYRKGWLTPADILTPDEYDTLVALGDKAERLAIARWKAYTRATGGTMPWHVDKDPEYVEYHSRAADRPGRDPDGLYDIVLTFRDYEGDHSDVALPSAILWDPEGITAKVVAEQEAKRAAYALMEAEVKAEQAAEREKAEKATLRKLAKKHGFELTRSSSDG